MFVGSTRRRINCVNDIRVRKYVNFAPFRPRKLWGAFVRCEKWIRTLRRFRSRKCRREIANHYLFATCNAYVREICNYVTVRRKRRGKPMKIWSRTKIDDFVRMLWRIVAMIHHVSMIMKFKHHSFSWNGAVYARGVRILCVKGFFLCFWKACDALTARLSYSSGSSFDNSSAANYLEQWKIKFVITLHNVADAIFFLMKRFSLDAAFSDSQKSEFETVRRFALQF